MMANAMALAMTMFMHPARPVLRVQTAPSSPNPRGANRQTANRASEADDG